MLITIVADVVGPTTTVCSFVLSRLDDPHRIQRFASDGRGSDLSAVPEYLRHVSMPRYYTQGDIIHSGAEFVHFSMIANTKRPRRSCRITPVTTIEGIVTSVECDGYSLVKISFYLRCWSTEHEIGLFVLLCSASFGYVGLESTVQEK